MKPLDKLTTLLCENERVNENLKQLKSGCKIKFPEGVIEVYKGNEDIFIGRQDFEIINPLLERHLRMYCESNLKNTEFVGNGFITYSCEGYDNDIYFGSYDLYKIELDNTKDLYEQSDSVIERILDFLIESKQGK